jgi:hypothetical protein
MAIPLPVIEFKRICRLEKAAIAMSLSRLRLRPKYHFDGQT